MRSVVWAWTPVSNDSNSAAAMAAKRRNFIGLVSTSRMSPGHDYTNPSRAGYLRGPAEGRHQAFQRRRKGAIGRHDAVRRRQFRSAVTGRGMAGRVGEQLRRLEAAALDRIRAAGM